MGLSLQARRPKLEASWVLTVWVVVGVELLVLFFLLSIATPRPDVPIWHALRQSETVLGFEGSHPGAVEPLLLVNLLLVAALWPCARAARRERRRNLAQLCLATAVALLLVSWVLSRFHGFVLRAGAHSAAIERVYTLEPDGSYSVRRGAADSDAEVREARP